MRLILTAVVLLGISMLSFAQEQKRLEIVFGGGYTFIVAKDGKTLTVGPVEKPHILATHYMKHDFKLSVTTGYVHPDETTIPPKVIGHGDDMTLGWDLTDRVVELLIDDEAPKPEKVQLPPPGNPLPCNEEVANVDNLRHIPVITDIAKDKVLADDLADRLDGRLDLTGGRLAVKALSIGCFEFSEINKQRRLAHGEKGLAYSRPLASGNEIVTFRVWKEGHKIGDPPKPQDKVGDIALVPQNGVLSVIFKAHHTGTTPANKPIGHFKHFYWLIEKDVPDHLRQIPTWLGPFSGGAQRIPTTPGEACPPVLYDLQP